MSACSIASLIYYNISKMLSQAIFLWYQISPVGHLQSSLFLFYVRVRVLCLNVHSLSSYFISPPRWGVETLTDDSVGMKWVRPEWCSILYEQTRNVGQENIRPVSSGPIEKKWRQEKSNKCSLCWKFAVRLIWEQQWDRETKSSQLKSWSVYLWKKKNCCVERLLCSSILFEIP